MKKFSATAAALVLFAAGCPSFRAAAEETSSVTLADRANPASGRIEIPADASPSQRHAAEELAVYLEKTTGARLAVGAGGARAAIRIETAAAAEGLGEDGFTLEARDGVYVIRGSRVRGCLYGAYETLERFAGVRWYSSWCEKAPRLDAVRVPDGFREMQKPAFAMRQPFWYDVNTHREFAARNKVNGFNHVASGGVDAKFGGDSFRFGGGLGSCHTFNVLLPPSKHFDAHPEWYSLVKGKRIKERTQLCLTNPEVLDRVAEEVLRRIRKDPGAKFYGVSQNDWYNYCECPKCKAVDDEEGSHAGTMVRFVNAVAERVEKEFPDAIVETLAYQYTRKPPKLTKLRKNVVPCLCTIECDFANPLATGTYKENVSFREDVRGWARQTDQLYVWDYVTDFYHYLCCFPNVEVLQDNVKFFRDNNVKELFEQGAYQGHHGHFAEMKAWILAKLLWNPEADVQALMRDFTDGYYGAAAPYVRDDCAELCDLYRKTKRPLSINEEVDFVGVPEEFFVRSRLRWNKALEAVKADPERLYNVKAGAAALDYTMLKRLMLKNEDKWSAAERAEAGTLAARLLRFAHEEARGYVRFGEWWPNTRRCTDDWRRLAGWGVFAPDAAHAPGTRRISLVSSIERSPENGRLWATWYASPLPGENHQCYCVLATSADDGNTWREVLVVDPDGDGPIRAFDPELWIAPDGKLRWTWCERFCANSEAGNAWNGGRPAKGKGNPRLGGEDVDRLMMLTLDAENAPAGGAFRPVQIASGVMMCKPTALKDGRWLLPVAEWFQDPSSRFVATSNGVDYAELPGGVSLPEADRKFDEHQVVEHADGRWTCITRTKRGLLESVSADGGKTWAPREPQRFRHTSSRTFFRRLASGNLLFVKHGPLDRDVGRKDLRAYVSDDDGETWKGGLLLDEREGISYPDACQKPDGTIVLTYDHDRTGDQEILFCEFTEADAMAGRDVSGKVKLRRTISRKP